MAYRPHLRNRPNEEFYFVGNEDQAPFSPVEIFGLANSRAGPRYDWYMLKDHTMPNVYRPAEPGKCGVYVHKNILEAMAGLEDNRSGGDETLADLLKHPTSLEETLQVVSGLGLNLTPTGRPVRYMLAANSSLITSYE